MLRNAIRAARLDPDFYNLVERDPKFLVQAGAIVVVVSIATGLGTFFASNDLSLIAAVTGQTVGGLIGWVLWAVITWFIGVRFFGGTADVGEMLRVLGFAQAPRIIGIVPFLGIIGTIWAIVASVVAVREGLDFTTGRALLTVIIGAIPLLFVVALTPLALSSVF